MARKKRDRFIQMLPVVDGFKPIGLQVKLGEEVILHFEEYESLNLCDYELLTHEEAAKLMNVSRPTYTRIYQSARNKIAKAFVEGKSIQIESGKSTLENFWFKCNVCHITFTLPENAPKVCPLCKSRKM